MPMRLGARLTLCALALAFPALASAQSDNEVNAGVQFNFSTPGARSLGMGGAFLASVDDATAAYSNPAGLLQLSKPEVLIEGRSWRYETPFADSGRAAGNPTGLGVDTVNGVRLGMAESEIEGISYAAFVLPRPTWALALYHHRAADFESSFSTGGIFGFDGREDRRLYPVRATYDLEISQTGVAFARQWNNGVAVGLGVAAVSLQLDSLIQRYDPNDFYGSPRFRLTERENFQTQTGDDQQAGFNVGLLWDRGGRMSTGLVYRFGPKFDTTIVSGAPSPEVPFPQRRETVLAGVFNLPDVFGGGVTFRPNEALSLSFDFNRIYYSQLIEEFTVTIPTIEGGTVSIEDFVLEDVTEIHAGAEYLVIGWRFPLALRAGAWYDPDHRLRSEGRSALHRALFFEGEDQIHGTAGLGMSIGNVQIDAAADISDQTRTVSLSTAIRF